MLTFYGIVRESGVAMENKPQDLTEANIRGHLTTIYSGLQHIHGLIDDLELTRDALLETLRDEKPTLLREYEAKLEALKTEAESNRGGMQVRDAIQLNIDLLRPKVNP